MATKTSSATRPIRPEIQSGASVYNSIMREIEPDLTTENLPTLEQKYRAESHEERSERSERYKHAFIEYKKRYAEYKRKQDTVVRAYTKSLLRSTEENTKVHESNMMIDIENAIFPS